MIERLRKKIFWITFLMPFSIIFLIIMAFDISNISSILANEQDILDYSSEYIEKYTDEIDTYLPISTDDLIEVSKTESGGNDIVRNLLYALLSSGIRIIKTDQNGSLLEYSGENESHAAIKLLIDKINDDDNPKGRVNRQLYSIVSTNDARYIILLDTVDWNTEIKQTILLSLLGITISILTLAAIARYIAIWTILPVKESISRQNRFIGRVHGRTRRSKFSWPMSRIRSPSRWPALYRFMRTASVADRMCRASFSEKNPSSWARRGWRPSLPPSSTR